MEIIIDEFRYIPRYIHCPVCKHFGRITIQRKVYMDSITYALESCSNPCDAVLLTHLVNSLVARHTAFTEQETTMLVAIPTKEASPGRAGQ